MAEGTKAHHFDASRPVLIIGAGVVGLTLAQGCRQAGIPYQIFESHDASSERSQGWGLTLHWSLNSLERTIGPELTALLPETNVDPSVEPREGCFLFLNAATCEVRYQVYPTKRFLRAGRQKLRKVLTSGLDIQYGKRLESFETTDNGQVIAKFKDGSTTKGGMLIGADGNNSVVRGGLKMEGSKSTPLPINLIGVVRHFTPEQAIPVRALNPLLFFAMSPESKTFFFFSIQEVIREPDGRDSYDAVVGVSWIVNDEKDAIPRDPIKRIAEMKRRAQGFAEPLLSMIMDIPDSSPSTALPLADFPTIPWDSCNGLVTMAGDSAHAMTMYRGEGANHGILDSALLVDQLKKIHVTEISQAEGIKRYEAEMQERGHTAVLRSRQAAFDGHNWDAIQDTSPLVGVRFPPATA